MAILILGAAGGIRGALARRLARQGVRLVLGGRDAARARRHQALEASTALHALGRVGEPEDVASAIGWQSSVTGQVLGVDGLIATVRSRA